MDADAFVTLLKLVGFDARNSVTSSQQNWEYRTPDGEHVLMDVYLSKSMPDTVFLFWQSEAVFPGVWTDMDVQVSYDRARALIGQNIEIYRRHYHGSE